VDYSHQLNLIATGGIDGRVEFWNMDERNKVAEIMPCGEDEITSMKFD
jgi:WD40 repeat protein